MGLLWPRGTWGNWNWASLPPVPAVRASLEISSALLLDVRGASSLLHAAAFPLTEHISTAYASLSPFITPRARDITQSSDPALLPMRCSRDRVKRQSIVSFPRCLLPA